jgi:hypothetical protein
MDTKINLKSDGWPAGVYEYDAASGAWTLPNNGAGAGNNGNNSSQKSLDSVFSK